MESSTEANETGTAVGSEGREPDLWLRHRVTTASSALLIPKMTFQVCLHLRSPHCGTVGGRNPLGPGRARAVEERFSLPHLARAWLAAAARAFEGSPGRGPELCSFRSSRLVSLFSVTGSICSQAAVGCRLCLTYLQIISLKHQRNPLDSNIRDYVN